MEKNEVVKLQKKKKIIYVILIILILIIVSGAEFNLRQKNIYYNDKKIAQEDDSYSVENFSGNSEDIEKYKLTYEKLSGDCLMWILNPKEETEITFNYNSNVDKGKFKVVLVDSDKHEIINILEGTEEGSRTIKLTTDKYFIKFVGEDAAGELEFSVDNNKNVVISAKN